MWNFSQNIRDNVLEAMSGIKGDNSLKIFGPDIDKLELLADKAKHILQDIQGVVNVGRFPRPWRDAPAIPRRSVEVPEVGRDDGRRQQRRQQCAGRYTRVDHGRGGEAIRHRHPLAEVASERRDVDPRHSRGHHQ